MNSGLLSCLPGWVSKVNVSEINLIWTTLSCHSSLTVCGPAIITNTVLEIVTSKYGCIFIVDRPRNLLDGIHLRCSGSRHAIV